MKTPLVKPTDNIAGAFKYYGSKGSLAKWIVPQFPAAPNHRYVEPYIGSGALFLKKPRHNEEIINDISDFITTFFRVVRNNVDDLVNLLNYTPYSRTEIHNASTAINNTKASDYTELEAARLLFVAYQQSFGGHAVTVSKNSTIGATGNIMKSWNKRKENLYKIADRLIDVSIECLDAIECIKRYDGKEAIIYLDPPYIEETRSRYNKRYQERKDPYRGKYLYEMSNLDHKDLVDTILNCKGKVILSGYYHEIYKPLEDAGWKVLTKDARTTESAIRTECLWMNY